MLKHLISLVLCSVIVAASNDGVNWVLLTAGSNEYFNYRHQADVCHAYQLIHKLGIPDERIVVMMYDDIANNEENPTKGVIINKPNGVNVYNNTLKDYISKDVTPENFLKVLQGIPTKVGTQKVINSGPNDNIFVYFSDHGAPGLLGFPNGNALHAKNLTDAIINMHQKKKFNKMVFYIEACESGSIFDELLPENVNVYATTAANPSESSYACYYDDERQTYLGDLYSVNWLEDSDRMIVNKETFFQQYQIVKKFTNESHVMQYGNLTLGKTELVGTFISEKKNFKRRYDPKSSMIYPKTDSIKTEDVRLSILIKKLAKSNNLEEKKIIINAMEKAFELKKIATTVVHEIAKQVSTKQNFLFNEIIEKKSKLTQHECYIASVNHLLEKCFSLKNEYVFRQLYILVNLCENQVKIENIFESINRICPVKFTY